MQTEGQITPPPRIVEAVQAKTILNRVQGMPFSWSINPYRGCAHGCAFCYARSSHTYLGLQTDDSFRRHLFVKKNAARILRQELSRRRMKGMVVIGTATDPYQPLEAKEQITRQVLLVLREFQVPVSITTRSPLILRDLDLLRSMKCSVNISINTLDLDVWRRLEPASPNPFRRIQTLVALRQEGIRAGLFLAPVLPRLTDGRQTWEPILEQAATAKACFVIPGMLRLGPEVKEWYLQVVQEHFPRQCADTLQLYRKGQFPPKPYVDQVMGQILASSRQRGIPTRDGFYSECRNPEEESQQLTFDL